MIDYGESITGTHGKFSQESENWQSSEKFERLFGHIRSGGELYRRLTGEDFAKTVPAKEFTERDGKPSDTDRPAGSGESLQHRRLKEWACANPRKIGLKGMKGKMEEDLPSGDRMDVLFTDGLSFAVVEVKSRLSNENDWKRGLYQCVKYLAVLKARELPLEVAVESILLTETPISDELKVRAKELSVRLSVHR